MEVRYNGAAGAYAQQGMPKAGKGAKDAKDGRDVREAKEPKGAAQAKDVKDAKAAVSTQKNNRTGWTGGVTKSDTYGNVIGQPELSEKASKYYDKLKEKYGDMEFVLVANDSLEGAEGKAASMNTGGKTIVLIDAEKIERMAEDESYANKIEGTISQGRDQLAQLAKQMSGLSTVTSYGMRVNDDGSASFFAVSQKNNDAVNKKMAEKREAKKTAAKQEAKKAEKKKAEQKIKDQREAKRAEEKNAKKLRDDDRGIRRKGDDFGPSRPGDDDFEIIEADTIEELMQKLTDREMAFRTDTVMTEEESYVGGTIDFTL